MYRTLIPTLGAAIGKDDSLHIVWASALEEVQAALNYLEINNDK
jgi:hypothetical protein